MRRISTAFFLLTILAGAASAQWRRNDDPYYRRNDPYRNDPYYRGDDPYYRGGDRPYGRDRGGYNDYGPRIVDRVRADLNNVRSLRRADRHERDHYQHAMEALDRFDRKLREGKWDRG